MDARPQFADSKPQGELHALVGAFEGTVESVCIYANRLESALERLRGLTPVALNPLSGAATINAPKPNPSLTQRFNAAAGTSSALADRMEKLLGELENYI